MTLIGHQSERRRITCMAVKKVKLWCAIIWYHHGKEDYGRNFWCGQLCFAFVHIYYTYIYVNIFYSIRIESSGCLNRLVCLQQFWYYSIFWMQEVFHEASLRWLIWNDILCEVIKFTNGSFFLATSHWCYDFTLLKFITINIFGNLFLPNRLFVRSFVRLVFSFSIEH